MQRYFVSGNQFSDSSVTIQGEDVHHITRVMRMTDGAEIICCNDHGEAALCKIAKTTNDYVEANIVKWLEDSPELPISITIASGLPKGDKLELIVQKGTELGAAEFIPFQAKRSITKWDDKKSTKKIDRLQKIAKEAAEQSHRNAIPHVYEPHTLRDLINISKNYDYTLVAFEESAKQNDISTLSQTLIAMNKQQKLLVVFGPEGGLDETEINLLTENGFLCCGLGPRILRTETAPLYVLAAASYQFEMR
ncbi:16S rRNA (uracil(1498)-N(3))-methyltransferase [Bacillus sp. HMF5848]|uniref:16S rRNA (uracil(1498)-N(3))-methyltransferase n=1 Tax=Bacillus sp. HMF5848 TaxID=2495421 RepID=UPI000F78F926|nr:16S rRNA (uracil(1498)-N(3))-methyltransferase [Bacillus sp. HMF5848]RSK27900.1 16S rRNA (uracil(1498)-N(3))-methyltransferase [Bacillus sp. HMF5848]